MRSLGPLILEIHITDYESGMLRAIIGLYFFHNTVAVIFTIQKAFTGNFKNFVFSWPISTPQAVKM